MPHLLCAGASGAGPAARKLAQSVTIVGPVVTQVPAVTTTCAAVSCDVAAGVAAGTTGTCYTTFPNSNACSVKLTQTAKAIQIIKLVGITKNNCNVGKMYWAFNACFINA
jgi:hypothetical protein